MNQTDKSIFYRALHEFAMNQFDYVSNLYDQLKMAEACDEDERTIALLEARIDDAERVADRALELSDRYWSV